MKKLDIFNKSLLQCLSFWDRKALYSAFVIGCLFATTSLYAQQTNVWTFGINAGVDFNSGTPVAIQSSLDNGTTPYGSVCDASGQLLFYTDGDTVYNKNGQIMPNGSGLTGVSDTGAAFHYGPTGFAYIAEGVIIVPMPDSNGKYYIFSTTSDNFSSLYGGTDTSLFERLYYSEVDMNLDGGLGDVVQGQKSILLDSNAIAGLTAVTGSDCNIWLLFRSLPHLQFKAYNISAAGINPTPVISGVASVDTFSSYNYPMDYLAIAPNHKKLASGVGFLSPFAYMPTSSYAYIQLFDFDTATGMVSDSSITLDYIDNYNDFVESLCFSPDNTKLYSSGRFSSHIYQFDVTAGNDSAAIMNSNTYLGVAHQTDLQLAPDGKIYFISDQTHLGAIDSPNLAGTDCDYNPSVLQSLSGTSFGYSQYNSLPNIVPIIRQDTVFASIDTAVVSGSIIAAPSGYSYYQWNDGTTNAQKTMTIAGTYWVAYSNYYCQQYIDTFQVTISNEGIPSITDAAMSVYPNPAQSEITVTINTIGQINGDVQIVNVLGQVVLQQPCNQKRQTLHVGDLPAGAYIINYVSKNAITQTLKASILICR